MYSSSVIERLNKDIQTFPQVHPITEDMHLTLDGVSRLVMLDRYSFKDLSLKTLKTGDIVLLTVKEDPKFPARGIGKVIAISDCRTQTTIEVDEEYRIHLEGKEKETGLVIKDINSIEKPLELFYEQIAKRNAKGLASVEKTSELKKQSEKAFYHILHNMDFVPAGRVLYGAGADTNVTFFNCYVMPYPHDSREGISRHREKTMEIMSRGGGVGTNGSTLRPRNALARGVNGKSSGAVSWLDDIAKLTHLVEQGGSRRGAQMIMLVDSHPDIIEFIISKMQNPDILRKIIMETNDKQIIELAKEKLRFIPLTNNEYKMYEMVVKHSDDKNLIKEAKMRLKDGGRYEVNNPDFLTGANISVAITHEFMKAVENDEEYELKFPDVENYTSEEMEYYNKYWAECGDVREWETKHKMGVKVYRTIKARELWNLINLCATYSAEPGIFFIDNANDMTNAKAYGQKVVATNPCGEQPLAPYSVCNLAAINLANMVTFEDKKLNKEKLKEIIQIGVRMQDNVIDATPYFLEENKKQALGERRIGLGIMGLHDLLIKCGIRYGSAEGNEFIDELFEIIATTAYRASIELAKEKGSFPFLVGQTDEETHKLREAFINTGYMKRMPEDIRQDILKYGIRNSHILTVAPTGSTGTMVGVSTGLEPYFAFKYFRSGRLGKNIEVNAPIVEDYLKFHPETSEDDLPDIFVGSMDLTPEEHTDVQITIQRWVDSSISKTVNAPKGYTIDQVKRIYERLHQGGAKGGTVYVDGSRDTQVLSLSTHEDKDDIVTVIIDGEEVAEYDKQEIEFIENEVVYGIEPGNTCPICREGIVEDIGGCSTCTGCKAQLKCGL